MLNENQTKVESLIYKGYSVFITGKGGSGKSYFLRSIIEKLRARGDRCFVTAPTGKAATNVGGVIVNNFAGIGTGSKGAHELIACIQSNEEALKRWQSWNVLIIDEESMLRRELFEKLEMIARCLKDNSQPFGGIQLIFSGDFYQLRPVTQSYATNESLYCFASPMWASCVDVCVCFFYENYRQCDTDLIDMLDDSYEWLPLITLSALHQKLPFPSAELRSS